MASSPWSDAEIAVLQKHSDRRDWLDAAIEELPDRTAKALRSRMQLVRMGNGTSAPRLHESAWMANAVTASQLLLEAIMRAGVRP